MIFLVWYLISSGKFDFETFKQFMSSDNILMTFLILFLLLIGHSAFAKRYQLFLQALRFRPVFKSIFSIIMVGVFYNNFLPGGTGGDIIRIYYIRRKENVPITVGTAATLLDRIVGMLGLVLVASVSLFLISGHINSDVSLFKEQKLLMTFTIFVPIAVVCSLLLLRIPSFSRLLEKIFVRVPLGVQIVSLLNTFKILVLNTKILFLSFLLCIFGHIVTLVCISMIAYSLYGAEAAYATIAVAGIVILISVVPVTPGNVGWTEWIADNLYRLFGIEGGATIFVLWRVVLLIFSMIGGVIYLRIGKKEIDEALPHKQSLS